MILTNHFGFFFFAHVESLAKAAATALAMVAAAAVGVVTASVDNRAEKLH